MPYQSRLGNVPQESTKAPVVTVATGDIALENIGQTINSVVISENDRVLAPNQTDTTENGIYVALANQSWVRASDMNRNADVITGQMILNSGDSSIWQITAPNPWYPGTNSLTFAQILGASSAFLDQNQTVTGDWTFTGTTVVPEATVTAHQAALTITESQISDLDKYTTAQVDALFTAIIATYADVAGNETISGDWEFTGAFNIGDPGFESGSVQFNDAVYTAVAKINEFAGADKAALIIHRHDADDTPGNLLFSKSASNDENHGDVADNEMLGRLLFAGWNDDTYNWGATILARVDGTPGATAMPSEIVLATSGAASRTPSERMAIRADGTIEMYNEVFIGQNGSGDAILSFYDDTNDAYRSIFWDDTEGAFFFEDATGAFQQFGTGSGGGPDLLLGGM